MKLFRIIYTGILLSSILNGFSQMITYLSTEQIKILSSLTATGVLNVVIKNEKETEDGALVKSIKEHWNVCEIHYMSELEFFTKYSEGVLNTNELYLYRNYTGLKRIPKKEFFGQGAVDGYYLTNNPESLNTANKIKKAPPYLFFSNKTLIDEKGKANEGLFRLMIKNFNQELKELKSNNAQSAEKAFPNVDGTFLMKNKEIISNRSIIALKEQDLDKNSNEFKRTIKIVQKYLDKKPKSIIVYPEDIEYAVKHEDSTALIYHNGNLFSTNGVCYAFKKISNVGGLANKNWAFAFLITPVIAVIIFGIIVN